MFVPLPFTGEHRFTLDPKGRVFLPSAFRDPLGPRLYIMKDPATPSLYIITVEEMLELSDKLSKIPSMDAKARDFIRGLFSQAYLCEMDKQGRILVPPDLRQYAGLTRDVVVVGANSRVEIWDASRYDKQRESREADAGDIAAVMAAYGI